MRRAVPTAFAFFALVAAGADFPSVSHAGGSLRYEQGVAVVRLRGTPDEMGRQWGVLATKNAPDVDGLRRRFLDAAGVGAGAELALTVLASRFEKGSPPNHLAEMKAASAASGRPPREALFHNGLFDLASTLGCATAVVSPERSATGGTLFARNFDWDPLPGLRDHTVLMVVTGQGKRPFAALTFAPICGAFTGMNDAGLVVALNQVLFSKAGDGSALDLDGTPTLLLARRLLEECGTVAEAEALLRSSRRASAALVTVADKTGGAVFEVTPKSVAVRRMAGGVIAGTNHFEAAGLRKAGAECRRLPALLAMQSGADKLGPDDLFRQLDRVNQGEITLQSMVFDAGDRSLRLKLADGKGPASARREAARFDLPKLWAE